MNNTDSSTSSPSPSTSKSANGVRVQRNVAEKQRRDKLNGYISELANIVPMVSMSSKRLDKTSILRLSAAYLRISKSPLNGKKQLKHIIKWCPSFLNNDQARHVLESVDGFLVLTTSNGKIVFTSRSVERYLGHQDIDLIGHSLWMFIHPEDVDTVKDELEKILIAFETGKRSSRGAFHCRMREKAQPRSEVVTYQLVHFAGTMSSCEEEDTDKNGVNPMFKAFVKIVESNPYSELSLEEAIADEYITRHSLDGTIIFADHRLATITGHMPHEVVGLNAYEYIHSDDASIALFAQHLMFSSDKGTGMIVYRLRRSDDKYVYLKSVGCLQFDKATNQVDHFVCVNQYLNDSEGDQQLKYFVDRFIPHIKDSSTSALFESVKALQVSSTKSSSNKVVRSKKHVQFEIVDYDETKYPKAVVSSESLTAKESNSKNSTLQFVQSSSNFMNGEKDKSEKTNVIECSMTSIITKPTVENSCASKALLQSQLMDDSVLPFPTQSIQQKQQVFHATKGSETIENNGSCHKSEPGDPPVQASTFPQVEDGSLAMNFMMEYGLSDFDCEISNEYNSSQLVAYTNNQKVASNELSWPSTSSADILMSEQDSLAVPFMDSGGTVFDEYDSKCSGENNSGELSLFSSMVPQEDSNSQPSTNAWSDIYSSTDYSSPLNSETLLHKEDDEFSGLNYKPHL